MKIAIASGKGGTGKTTLSTNLASLIAEHSEVVLVDLDVEEPNSGLFFKGDPTYEEDTIKMIPQWDQSKCTFCGICSKVCNYHAVIQLGPIILVFPELCHGCYACSEMCPTDALPMIPKKNGTIREYQIGKLHLVEGRLYIGEEQAVPLIKSTKIYVNRNYDDSMVVLYDSPPGTSCPVMEATRDVDFVILVTEPTPFGLHDLSLAVETMRVLGKVFGVVINRDGIGNNDVVEYCNKENIPILAKIPNNRRIAELYSSGNLVYQHFPEVKESLSNLWNYCLKAVKGAKK